ncbi:hypothetical protein Btru_031716 [Bulinus truncatus]|nr:hypothetical protein Btru_031716 [Bulinus truncatus]
MEPGQIYSTWVEFKDALDAHCRENKVVFNISNAKTIEQANNTLKKKPYFGIHLKYASIILVCKHYGSYKSLSAGLRPKQRSYKINCKAYISVSACRKENHLIIRDSYHIHSHPCSEEIYNSYPEVRRMSKEEKKMVGTLMEMGVPTSQIKNAVGRHITHKDLQNAKTHIKAVKLGIKSEDPVPGHRRRRTYKELQEEGAKAHLHSDGDGLSESDEEEKLHESSSVSSVDNIDHTSKHQIVGEEHITSDATSASYTVSIGEMESLVNAKDALETVETTETADKDQGSSEMGGLTGLLAAAGLSSDSVVLTVNNQVHAENSDTAEMKSSYTVTVSLPDGDVTQTGTNLQELLKGLPLGKIVAKPLSPVKVKMEEITSPEVKSCTKCGGYISPLDGHTKCLSCLGPEHIHEIHCEHCLAMSQEQFNIRRKKMVALRMKALKEMRLKRKSEHDPQDSDYSPSVRKSKRPRKPMNFGPDMYVEDAFLSHGTGDSKPSKKNSTKPSKVDPDNSKDFLYGSTTKVEPVDEEESTFSNESINFNTPELNLQETSHNSQRFSHILSQAKVFDDVTLFECENGSLLFSPGPTICSEFQKSLAIPELSPIPPTVMGKYILNSQFESAFCCDPPPLIGVTDPALDLMGKGLVKLVKNATAQTRIAVYDKLFTRVGVGMADEALSILSELCGKVSEVTEISQEEITNNLQTALDTIQALKDVLEELGVMSQDAISTASHQRSISLNTLNSAKKLLIPHRIISDQTTQRRSKFLPFARAKTSLTKSSSELSATSSSSHYNCLELPMHSAFKLREFAEKISSNQADPSMAGLPMVTLATSQDGLDLNPEISTAFIMSGKEFTVGSLNSELIQGISTSKDGIIELHVIKNADDLLEAEETAVEVIQTE